ncbi:unnamed protein product [Closterium sp. Naga37s-1]|nr:unnamed protein product [Closterium sp. Naga37s-1]
MRLLHSRAHRPHTPINSLGPFTSASPFVRSFASRLLSRVLAPTPLACSFGACCPTRRAIHTFTSPSLLATCALSFHPYAPHAPHARMPRMPRRIPRFPRIPRIPRTPACPACPTRSTPNPLKRVRRRIRPHEPLASTDGKGRRDAGGRERVRADVRGGRGVVGEGGGGGAAAHHFLRILKRVWGGQAGQQSRLGCEWSGARHFWGFSRARGRGRAEQQSIGMAEAADYIVPAIAITAATALTFIAVSFNELREPMDEGV